jgi:pimeloyl-ACP methyl ester carboxylesterase
MNECREATLTLADGRRLGFAEWGAPDGRPVLWHPGTPGSRLTFPAPEVAARLGLRIVATERPGFGRSDPQPGRSILDWPKDLTALADHLGISRFAVAGWSGAGPYLLAAAHRLPERVTTVAMIGCIGPLDAPDAERGMAWSRRAYFALLRRTPKLAAALVRTAFDRRNVEPFYRAMTRGLAEVDQKVLSRPEVWSAQIAAVSEALAPGFDGFFAELRLAAAPWGFSLAEIRPPVYLWHGTEDASTPLSMAQYMASRLPHATLRILEGEGHFLLFDHAEQILGMLLS